MPRYIMALDAGTTSNRCILFNQAGDICAVAQKEFTQIFPQPGWVEHDADEIFETQLAVARQALASIGASAADIAAIGITNQRETTVVWDKYTGQPVCNAIVWQCRRTTDICSHLRAEGLTEAIREKTAVRNRRNLAHLEADRRTGSCHGLLQRFPHHAVQHQHPAMG